MRCLLCRYLRWSISRDDPGWVEKADELETEFLFYGLNNGDLFNADADVTRLRQAFEMWRSNPVEAFTGFLVLAEGGSVWSMIQVGVAYESGRGVPLDRIRAEEWYRKAYEQGSDLGLVRAGYLTFKRGDIAEAKTILSVGVSRGLTPAMRYLAWMELRLSKKEDARGRARALYEQAIASGDLAARMLFARSMVRGRFGLRAIPAGIRSLLAAGKEVVAQVNARQNSRLSG